MRRTCRCARLSCVRLGSAALSSARLSSIVMYRLGLARDQALSARLGSRLGSAAPPQIRAWALAVALVGVLCHRGNRQSRRTASCVRHGCAEPDAVVVLRSDHDHKFHGATDWSSMIVDENTELRSWAAALPLAGVRCTHARATHIASISGVLWLGRTTISINTQHII